MTFATYLANPAEGRSVQVVVLDWRVVNGEAENARIEFIDGERVWVPAHLLSDIYTE